jgi:hypothetical protein
MLLLVGCGKPAAPSCDTLAADMMVELEAQARAAARPGEQPRLHPPLATVIAACKQVGLSRSCVDQSVALARHGTAPTAACSDELDRFARALSGLR